MSGDNIILIGVTIMSWILAVYFLNGEVLANEYNTEKECVIEMRQKIKAMELHNEKLDKVECKPGIVISAIDDDE